MNSCTHLEIGKTHIKIHLSGFSWEVWTSGKIRARIPTWHKRAGREEQPALHPGRGSLVHRKNHTHYPPGLHTLLGVWPLLRHLTSHYRSDLFGEPAMCIAQHLSVILILYSIPCRFGNPQLPIRNWNNCQSLAFFDQWHTKYGSRPSLFCEN